MEPWRRRASILTSAAVLAATPIGAQSQAEKGLPAPSSSLAPGTVTAVFVPPVIGTPASRVGAGARGSKADDWLVALLLPPAGGIATMRKPPLIWRLTGDVSGMMRTELLDIALGGTRVTHTVEGRFCTGYYVLDLARSELTLEPGRIYRWSVSVIEPATGRILSSASGFVERVDSALGDQGDPMANARSTAAQGLWFDALAPQFRVSLVGQARLVEADPIATITSSANLPPSAYTSD